MKVQIAEVRCDGECSKFYVYRWLKWNPRELILHTACGKEYHLTRVNHMYTSVMEEKDAYVEELCVRGDSVVPYALVKAVTEKARDIKHLFVTQQACINNNGEIAFVCLSATLDRDTNPDYVPLLS